VCVLRRHRSSSADGPGRIEPSATRQTTQVLGAAQPGQHLLGIELQEAFELAADLADIDLVETRVDIGTDGIYMKLLGLARMAPKSSRAGRGRRAD
jgi:hypothetical protein